MKIGIFFEYIFAGTHCDSHFAHFCLFIMLLCLFYSFIKGVKEQLDAKDEEERRKHNMLQMERFKKLQMKKSTAANKAGADSSVTGSLDDKSRGKDFSELQKE